MYYRQTSDGNVFEFTRDVETLTGYSTHGSAQAHADGFSLVLKRRLEDYEGIAFGRGSSQNPDRAEGFLYFDVQDDAAAAVSGMVELVVLNSADEVLATIERSPISEVSDGDPSGDRGTYGVPFPYVRLKRGKGEVIGDDYQIGVRVKTDSGTSTISASNSTLKAEGHSGRKQN